MPQADSDPESVQAPQRRPLLATGDDAQAESQVRASITSRQGSVGPDAHRLAVDIHRLATVLAASGRLDEAIEHYHRALAIMRQQLVITLHDLAILCAALGHDREARALWDEARATLHDARPHGDERIG